MNRMQPIAELDPAPDASSRFYGPEADVDASLAVDSCHVTFTPLHYEPGYSYPLLVWLHGPDANESQLKQIMPLVSLRNYVGVAPRGTLPADVTADRNGYRWHQSEDHILLATQRVLACVEMAQAKFNVAGRQIFLAGLGCGGTMALRICLENPAVFAGALTLGGPFPSGYCPLRRLNEIRRLPLLLAVGAESEAYCQMQVCQDLRLFHAAGMSISLRQYPGGDELTTIMLEDMNRWIMEQICPSDAACTKHS